MPWTTKRRNRRVPMGLRTATNSIGPGALDVSTPSTSPRDGDGRRARRGGLGHRQQDAGPAQGRTPLRAARRPRGRSGQGAGPPRSQRPRPYHRRVGGTARGGPRLPRPGLPRFPRLRQHPGSACPQVRAERDRLFRHRSSARSDAGSGRAALVGLALAVSHPRRPPATGRAAGGRPRHAGGRGRPAGRTGGLPRPDRRPIPGGRAEAAPAGPIGARGRPTRDPRRRAAVGGRGAGSWQPVGAGRRRRRRSPGADHVHQARRADPLEQLCRAVIGQATWGRSP